MEGCTNPKLKNWPSIFVSTKNLQTNIFIFGHKLTFRIYSYSNSLQKLFTAAFSSIFVLTFFKLVKDLLDLVWSNLLGLVTKVDSGWLIILLSPKPKQN